MGPSFGWVAVVTGDAIGDVDGSTSFPIRIFALAGPSLSNRHSGPQHKKILPILKFALVPT